MIAHDGYKNSNLEVFRKFNFYIYNLYLFKLLL